MSATGSFDAGSVSGSLVLDISEYAHGMIEAEGLMRAFPPLVVEFLENPLIGLISIAKEAGEALLDMASEVMNAANEIGLAAQKTGTSVEYFSQLSWAAKEVNVSTEQLGVGMRMLQTRVADAVQQGGQAAAEFQRFGISTQFLSENINNSEALMRKMFEVMDRLPEGAQRNAAAMRLMGREGAQLIPLLAMGTDAIDAMGQRAREWGALETDESANAGRAWRQMSVEVDMAMEGIKKTLGEALAPKLMEEANTLLNWVRTHGEEIRADVIKIANEVRDAIDDIGPTLLFLLEHIDDVVKVLGAAGIGYVVGSAIKGLAALGAQFLALAGEIGAATAAEEAFAAASARSNTASAAGAGGARGMGGNLLVPGAMAGYATTHSTGGAIGGGLGAEGGAIMGAEIGTAVMPGIGTVVGGIIGALAGWFGGAQTGDLIQQTSVRIYHHFEGDVKVTEDPHEAAKQVAEHVEKNVAGPIRTMQDDMQRRRAEQARQMVARATGALSR